MQLPSLPVPLVDFISYITSISAPINEAIKPYREYESSLRSIFAQENTNALLDDPNVNLVPLFTGHEQKIVSRPRDPESQTQLERDTYILPLAQTDRRPYGSPAVVPAFQAFKYNFNLFSESSLVDLDWNNVVVAGSAVLTALLPVPVAHAQSKRTQRNYYHQHLAPASDVDLFLYGLTEEQAIDKIKQIEASIRDSILYETTVIRTKYALTIASQYPCRHIQIVLRIYKNVSEILTGFDVDSSCVAYDGRQVYATPRAIAALMTQTNTIDLSRRSPSYENRLSKYAKRGFEVHCPFLDRSRIDPTIFDRSFGRVLGLARLLVLETLPTPNDRDEHSYQRRIDRGRPELHWSARYQVRLKGNIKEKQPDEIPEWAIEDDVSDYHTVTIPYGPRFHAKRIEKLLFTKDLLLNAEWNKPKDREVNLHRHPAFFGRVEDVITDCCGFCPEPMNKDAKIIAEKEERSFIKGMIGFITDNPGRQQIGSFNPLTDNDWTEMAYIGNTARLCQAIVDHDLPFVEHWCRQHGADVNRRDHTGRTPLHLAAICGTADIVACLVQNGARLIARLADGQTALHLAAYHGHTAMMRHILEKSESNAREEERKAIARRKAIEEENDSASDLEMSDEGTSDEDDGSSGSFVRVKSKALAEATACLDLDANPDDPDVFDVNIPAWDYPTSPLHLAIVEGHVEAVTLLVDAFGADVLLPVKIKDRLTGNAQAAILTLVLSGLYSPNAPQMTQVLLELGASTTQADTNKNVALSYIIGDGNLSVLEALFHFDQSATMQMANHITLGQQPWECRFLYPLQLAIGSGNEALAMRLIDMGAGGQVSMEAFSDAHEKAYKKDPATIAIKTYYSRITQPIISAIRCDMPLLASRILNESNINTLSSRANQQRIQSGDQQKFDIAEEEAKSVLDYVRDRITAIKSKPSTEMKAIIPIEYLENDDHYLHDLPTSSYRRWVAEGDLETAKLVQAAMESQRAEKLSSRANTSQACTPEKATSLKIALEAFESLETRLCEMGAKTFPELFPEIKPGKIVGNFHSRYVGPLKELPPKYGTNFKFRVADLGAEKQIGYLALFEAAFAGDVKTVKALTLAPWDMRDFDFACSSLSMDPLQIATPDTRGFTPFSLAAVRGHLSLARIIIDIAAAQYSPNEDQPKYRYSIGPARGYEECCEDDQNPEDHGTKIYAELVDDVYTYDNIASLPATSGSKISPRTMVNWLCETWRCFETLEKARCLSLKAPPPKPTIATGYDFPMDKEYSQQHIAFALDRQRSTSSSLLAYAIAQNDYPLFEFLLLQSKSLYSKEERKADSSSDLWQAPSKEFEQALQLGRVEMILCMIEHAGVKLPLHQMVAASGVKVEQAPAFYQGLSVHGEKRQDWADQSRGIVGDRKTGEDTSPLLLAAYSGNVDSTELFLGDAPHRRYENFVGANKENKSIQALDKGPGGIEAALCDWLEARGNLIVHAAVLATPMKQATTRQLQFVLDTMPEAINNKNCAGTTPLHAAFAFGRYAAARLLIARGADQLARDKRGQNVLHYYLQGIFQKEIATIACHEAFLALLDPSTISTLFTQKTRSDIYRGCETPLAHILRLIREVFPWRSQGITPRAIDHLDFFLRQSRGADLNVIDGSGNLPLHTAVMSSQTKLARLFLQHAPHLVHRENCFGQTPVEVAQMKLLAKQISNGPPTLSGEAPTRSLPQKPDAYFVPGNGGRDPLEDGPENVLRLCQETAAKHPGKRVLIGLSDVNEIAKRVEKLPPFDKDKQDLKPVDEVSRWMTIPQLRPQPQTFFKEPDTLATKAAAVADWELAQFMTKEEREKFEKDHPQA